MALRTYTYLESPLDISGSYHIVTGGKGGIGKSFVARMLSEVILYGLSSGDIQPTIELRFDEDQEDHNDKGQLRFFDIDPENHTFQSTFRGRALRADVFLSDENRELDERKLGTYFFPPEFPVRPRETRVYDIGSNFFDPMIDYFVQSSALLAWQEDHRPLLFHLPLCGYQYFRESLQSVIKILYKTNREAQLMFWINDYLPTRETDDGPSIQTYILEEQKYWATKRSEVSSVEELEQSIVSLDELYEKISRDDFEAFTKDDLHAIYYYLTMASGQGRRLVVLVNSQKKSYKSTRNSLTEALSKKVLFTEFIQKPDFPRPDRMMLETFFFAGKDAVFNQVMKALQGFFEDFARNG